MITGALNALLHNVDAIKVNLDALQPMGLILISCLAVIRISRDGLKVMFSGGGFPQILSYLVISVFVISTSSWLIQDGSDNLLTGFVQNATDSAAALVLGGKDLYSADTFSSAFSEISAAINENLDKVNKGISITNFPEVIMQNLMFYWMSFISYILTLINQLTFITVLIVIKMVIKVPLLLMPVFLPFVILPETKQLAFNWFNFFLECVLLKLIAAVLLGMLTQLLISVAKMLTGAGLSEIVPAILMISAGQFAMFLLLKRSPQIAQQLARFRA